MKYRVSLSTKTKSTAHFTQRDRLFYAAGSERSDGIGLRFSLGFWSSFGSRPRVHLYAEWTNRSKIASAIVSSQMEPCHFDSGNWLVITVDALPCRSSRISRMSRRWLSFSRREDDRVDVTLRACLDERPPPRNSSRVPPLLLSRDGAEPSSNVCRTRGHLHPRVKHRRRLPARAVAMGRLPL